MQQIVVQNGIFSILLYKTSAVWTAPISWIKDSRISANGAAKAQNIQKYPPIYRRGSYSTGAVA
jgi:hypothetical protein